MQGTEVNFEDSLKGKIKVYVLEASFIFFIFKVNVTVFVAVRMVTLTDTGMHGVMQVINARRIKLPIQLHYVLL